MYQDFVSFLFVSSRFCSTCFPFLPEVAKHLVTTPHYQLKSGVVLFSLLNDLFQRLANNHASGEIQPAIFSWKVLQGQRCRFNAEESCMFIPYVLEVSIQIVDGMVERRNCAMHGIYLKYGMYGILIRGKIEYFKTRNTRKIIKHAIYGIF